MLKHNDFCNKLADYYDPDDPRYNDEISTFSLPHVNESYELTDGTLLAKEDVPLDEFYNEYKKRFDEILAKKGQQEGKQNEL